VFDACHRHGEGLVGVEARDQTDRLKIEDCRHGLVHFKRHDTEHALDSRFGRIGVRARSRIGGTAARKRIGATVNTPQRVGAHGYEHDERAQAVHHGNYIPNPKHAAARPVVMTQAERDRVAALESYRQKLYEEVWSLPTQKVANGRGVSDVAIAKTCKRLMIPKPPRGYWNKKAAGLSVPDRPALKPFSG
jgi:hypothetical protein